jgi:hypothetical protein
VSTFYFVQGDDGPQLKVTLTRDETGEIIDTTGKTVVWKYRKKGSTTLLGTLSDISSAEQKEAGIAIFQWGPTDLDIAAGNYEAEIEITDTTGLVETVYELIEFSIREDF